ncbi:OmpA family protein [Eudoraea adriatica]|uniref:OmpA family protein n=1 Tax=Eudoraea adriatica TaxID=446681 RepID=UPI0003686DDA|nr:OmpA family protein [Eudoraea adriatica]
MKNLMLFLIVGFFIQMPAVSEAQILGKLKKKAEKQVEKEIDKALEGEAEEPQTEEKQTKEDQQKPEETKDEQVARPWSKYDFVPGETILFEDNLEGEQNGEFPSQWDLIDGYVENALFSGENVIRFPIENSGATIKPLMKKEGDYLPEKFTIEFDMYLSSRTSKYTVYLWDKGKSNRRPDGLHAIDVGYDQEASYEGGKMQRKLPEASQKPYPHWRHVAISFNVRALKIYIDQDRLVMIPNVTGNPSALSIHASTYDFGQTGDYPTMIKNIRIAEGAVKLYDRFISDGKIVTNGIKFDSGKATLKLESMGVINEIVKLMKEHPEINFSVEGHTDSDGDAQFNIDLSEQRANTVINELVARGIDGKRMVAKGFGEDIPVADNTSPEGKANNRRVEFVKMDAPKI